MNYEKARWICGFLSGVCLILGILLLYMGISEIKSERRISAYADEDAEFWHSMYTNEAARVDAMNGMEVRQ